MRHLYFIRHGESEMNVAGVQSGHTDAKLTAKGHGQADTAGKEAKKKGITPDKVYSSPLQRAHHTAIGVVKHLDFPPDSIELLDNLKERNFGVLEGKNMHNDYGISLDVYFENETAIDHIRDIEKLEDMHQRAAETVEFMKQQPVDTILIVAHGAFGRALNRVVNNIPFSEKVPSIENAKLIKLI